VQRTRAAVFSVCMMSPRVVVLARRPEAGFFLSCCFFVSLFVIANSAQSLEKYALKIRNDSGAHIDVYWVSTDEGSPLTLQSSAPVYNGATLALSSYESHVFEVQELPMQKGGACTGGGYGSEVFGVCRTARFKVSSHGNDQLIHLKDGFVLHHVDNRYKTATMVNDALSECNGTASASCLTDAMSQRLVPLFDELNHNQVVRGKMAPLIENYTCADHEMPTTEALRNETYIGESRKRYKAQIMVDRDSSKVHVLDNFTNAEECAAILKESAKNGLHRATVAKADGGSMLSENRKALQASVRVQHNDPSSLISQLSNRVFTYANKITKYGLEPNGQEDLMSIQYSGKGYNEESPDRYMPHCDGDCSGAEYSEGGRVATMVIYCEVPEVGGQTNFAKSNIHVVPKQYSATFFSYKGSDNFMDDGFTEHSGCPVVIGKKKIVTQWMRLGVSDDVPWNAYDTSGVLIESIDKSYTNGIAFGSENSKELSKLTQLTKEELSEMSEEEIKADKTAADLKEKLLANGEVKVDGSTEGVKAKKSSSWW
jgi:hypothetical protein